MTKCEEKMTKCEEKNTKCVTQMIFQELCNDNKDLIPLSESFGILKNVLAE